MKFPRMIAVLGLTCALLLSGCGSEETSSLSELMASKKKRNTTVAAYKNA